MRLRGTGTFRPVSPVVFVTVAEGISQCEALADAVRRGPLETDLLFPYHPHVTVAHHLDDDVMDQAFDELAASSASSTPTGSTSTSTTRARRWQRDAATSSRSASNAEPHRRRGPERLRREVSRA